LTEGAKVNKLKYSGQLASTSGVWQFNHEFIIGVGGRKVMLEKFFLAIAVTFSLNVFIQVQFPMETNATYNSQHLQAQSPRLFGIEKKDD